MSHCSGVIHFGSLTHRIGLTFRTSSAALLIAAFGPFWSACSSGSNGATGGGGLSSGGQRASSFGGAGNGDASNAGGNPSSGGSVALGGSPGGREDGGNSGFGRAGGGGATDGGGATGGGGPMGGGGTMGRGGATGGGGRIDGAGAGGRVAQGGASETGGQAMGGNAGRAPSAGSSGAGAGGAGANRSPCDIYDTGGTPCVAAHSTVRALFAAYAGKLYQLRNSGGTTQDISAVSAGGVADAAAQDAFCSGTTCVITVVYDQTGHGNDLQYQGSGSPVGGQDKPASATLESLKLAGNKVYSLYIKPGNSYWVDGSKSGIPTGSKPEGMYMVTSGKHYNSGCCFDYGNSETDRKADGNGAMDAINFGTITTWGTGAGAGPWILADLEYGLFSQGSSGKSQNDPTQTAAFVTAVLKNDGTTEFAIKGADATSGSLTTYYQGALPAGWSPMKKQGAIVLGSGGDCCATNTNQSEGTFYEGCLVAGYPSDETEQAIQANIVAAGYGR